MSLVPSTPDKEPGKTEKPKVEVKTSAESPLRPIIFHSGIDSEITHLPVNLLIENQGRYFHKRQNGKR